MALFLFIDSLFLLLYSPAVADTRVESLYQWLIQ